MSLAGGMGDDGCLVGSLADDARSSQVARNSDDVQ